MALLIWSNNQAKLSPHVEFSKAKAIKSFLIRTFTGQKNNGDLDTAGQVCL